MGSTLKQILTLVVIIVFIVGVHGRATDRKIKVKCSSNKDCHKEGMCFYGICRCLGWFSGNGKYCKEVTKSCPDNFKCGSRTSCLVHPLPPKEPYCRCNMGYHTTNEGKCVGCINNGHCNKKTYSICIKGECGCPKELILGKKSCEPAPLKSCRRDLECHPKAECEDGKCVCQGRRVGDGKNCRDALEKQCPKETNKCGDGFTCLLDPLMPETPLCKCDTGLVKNGKCVDCFSDVHCQAESRQCTKGTCKCKSDLIPDGPKGKTCKPGPLHPCTKAKDCHKDAECHRGKCHCKGQSAGNGKICRASLPCPQGHHCDANSVCVVDPLLPDKPDCKCNLDFKKSDDGTCIEMNECEKKGLTCSGGRVCKQVDDSYGCSCPDGFSEILDGENKICQDTDECQKPDACPANSKCENTEGAFQCNCKEGFQKNAYGACEDLDECAEYDALCMGDGEQCENEEGGYSCTCKQGYVHKNGGCVKAGECNCKSNEECHEGKCKCNKRYKKSPQGKCVRKRGNLQGASGRSVQVTSHLGALVLALLGRLAFTA